MLTPLNDQTRQLMKAAYFKSAEQLHGVVGDICDVLADLDDYQNTVPQLREEHVFTTIMLHLEDAVKRYANATQKDGAENIDGMHNETLIAYAVGILALFV